MSTKEQEPGEERVYFRSLGGFVFIPWKSATGVFQEIDFDNPTLEEIFDLHSANIKAGGGMSSEWVARAVGLKTEEVRSLRPGSYIFLNGTIVKPEK